MDVGVLALPDQGTVGLPDALTENLAEMEESQEQVGMLLELAYLALKDHPSVAKEVRMSAHTARSQHMMTLGLMKTYVVTATNILKTMIPMMRTAVKIKKSAILNPMFQTVLKFSEDMKKETDEARKQYLKLQTKIQKDAGDVEIENTRVKTLEEEIKEKRRIAKKKKGASEKTFKRLEKERKSKEEEIERAKKQRDKMMKQSVSVNEENQKTYVSFMQNLMAPRFLNPKKATAIIKGVFGTVAMAVNTISETAERKQALDASKQAHEVAKSLSAEKENMDATIRQEKTKLLDAEHQMRMLQLKKSSLGDLESLMEASVHLANIDEKLLSMISFWDNFSAFLLGINQQGNVGKSFIDAFEVEEYAAMFLKELDSIEKAWTRFGTICSDYAKKADRVIPRIYGFLSLPIDNMSPEEREQRSAEVFHQIIGTMPLMALEG